MEELTFENVWNRWPWRPIQNCPGRFVLSPKETPQSFQELLGGPCLPQTHVTHLAKDPVLVLAFEEGGLISYQQSDGKFIHTLNTQEGLHRKLRQLGIALDPYPHSHFP